MPNNYKTLLSHSIEHSTVEQSSLLETPVNDGLTDKMQEIRLKIGIIENFEIDRNPSNFDPLDVKGVVNMTTGKVTIRWVDIPGGVVGASSKSTTGKYKLIKENQNELPELTKTYISDDSRKEYVPLTHAFIWADDKNWCGFNYIPPIGSRVIVGFQKRGAPTILGYLPTHYKIFEPILKPGEMCLKGYGKNYIHLRNTNKLDIKAWSVSGESDTDDPDRKEFVKSGTTLWIRLNADQGFIRISASNGESENYSGFLVTPDSVSLMSGGSDGGTTFLMDKNQFKITSSRVEFDASDSMIFKSSSNIAMNSDNDIIVKGGSAITVQSGATIAMNSGRIDLNS